MAIVCMEYCKFIRCSRRCCAVIFPILCFSLLNYRIISLSYWPSHAVGYIWQQNNLKTYLNGVFSPNKFERNEHFRLFICLVCQLHFSHLFSHQLYCPLITNYKLFFQTLYKCYIREVILITGPSKRLLYADRQTIIVNIQCMSLSLFFSMVRPPKHHIKVCLLRRHIVHT